MSSVDYVNVNVEVKNLVVSQISMYIDIDRQINVSFAILFLVTSLHRDHNVLMISCEVHHEIEFEIDKTVCEECKVNMLNTKSV